MNVKRSRGNNIQEMRYKKKSPINICMSEWEEESESESEGGCRGVSVSALWDTHCELDYTK
jgi:hypothetical protein